MTQLLMIIQLLGGYTVQAIPNPFDALGSLADEISEAIGDAFTQALEAVTDFLEDTYTQLLETALDLLSTIGMPPAEMFQKGPGALLLGGTYGLSVNVLRLAIVVAALIMIVATAMRRRSEVGERTILSVIWLAVFAAAFAPMYGLADSTSRAVTRGFIRMIAQTDGGSGDTSSVISALTLPHNFLGMVLTAGVGSIILFCVVIELAAIWFCTLMCVVLYPLAIAMQPLGKFGLVFFNGMTAMLIVMPLSLIGMGFCLSLGVASINLTQSLGLFGGEGLVTSIVAPGLTLTGGLAALLVPYFLFSAVYSRVQRVSGNSIAALQSGLEIASMPAVTVKETERSVSHNRAAMLTSFAAGVAVTAVQSDKPAVAAKDSVVSRVAQAAKASPDPRIRAGAWAADFGKMYKDRRKQNQPGGGTT